MTRVTYVGPLEAVVLPDGLSSEDAPAGVVQAGQTISVAGAPASKLAKMLPAAAGWKVAGSSKQSKAGSEDAPEGDDLSGKMGDVSEVAD